MLEHWKAGEDAYEASLALPPLDSRSGRNERLRVEAQADALAARLLVGQSSAPEDVLLLAAVRTRPGSGAGRRT